MTGDELKTLRISCGCTKGHAAKLAGVTRNTWGLWESGTWSVPDSAVAQLVVVAKLVVAATRDADAANRRVRDRKNLYHVT